MPTEQAAPGSTSRPIEDYALIGDLHTAALVSAGGSVDWLCLPRFDSPACFAALLGDTENGHWSLAPTSEEATHSRRYRPDTLILETTWKVDGGSVRVTEFMPPRGRAADMVRIVEGIDGTVRMRTELRLRFDYGLVMPWVEHGDLSVSAIAGPDAVWLRSSIPVRGGDGASVAEFDVSAGERVTFVLTHVASHHPEPPSAHPVKALGETEAFWTDWIDASTYDGPWDEAVRRSLITLKALTYAPTGGIVAAATTSLPEDIGGVRNWDYRYCWLRDASFTLQALLTSGFRDEAAAWREWLLRAVAGDPADLQIMYGLDGRRRLQEYEIPWLSGYENSRPVRIGNSAAEQFQLDVWGEVLDGLHLARQAGLSASGDAWNLQRALMDFLEGNWRHADNSLWEVRGPREHFVHSKVMAWAGTDRMIDAAQQHGLRGPVDRWRALRDTIRDEIMERGYDADRKTFTQYYGSDGVDAALLLLPRVGFVPWTDERFVGTLAAVETELLHDGFLRRYLSTGVDGLPGGEGAFLACSFWMVDALAGTGRVGEATAMFERLVALSNDVGLLAEEYDPRYGRQVGNVPQAFSHETLVVSAQQLALGAAARTPGARAGRPTRDAGAG